LKKLIALFSAAAFSFALGTALAEEGSPDPLTSAPTKSFADMKKEKKVKKPAAKKKSSKKKTSGKRNGEKTTK